MLKSEIKFKKKWSDSGVSEVVGNILILAITVVLFSSVIAMVYQMPTPNDKINADFTASLEFSTESNANLTLKHNGGEVLYDYRTKILIDDESSPPAIYDLIDDPDFTSSTPWSIGMEWTMAMTGISTSTKVDVSIIDTEANAIIWSSAVSGGLSSNAPIILQRWADADITTSTADPIRESDTGFYIFVRVDDPDYDLNSSGVTLDATAIGGSASKSADSYSNSVWRFDFSNIPAGQAANYDGKIIYIHALDEAGHEAIETFQLVVLQPDIYVEGDTFWENGTAEDLDNEGGLPAWMVYQGSGQGYVVLGENLTAREVYGVDGYSADVNDPKHNFVQGDEYVFVRVGSTTMKNLQSKNILQIVNRLSGEIVSPPSNSSAFYRLPYSGSAYLYQAKFNSSLLSPGAYDLFIDLQSSVLDGGSPAQLKTITYLVIEPQPGQESVFVPSLAIYKDSSRDAEDEWGTKDYPFDLSNASLSTVWVEITMWDAGPATTIQIGEVVLKDFIGRVILYGSPPTTSSGLLGANQSDGLTKYYFPIDLRLKNGENWAQGRSAYTLTLSNIFDSNEGVYTISIPIWVRSPTNVKNFIAATTGIGVGHQNFAHMEYLFQLENNKFFTTRVLDEQDESPGSGGDPMLTIYKALYFDMDGDGDRDVLAAMSTAATPRDDHNLVFYINRLNEYGIWERRQVLDQYTDNKEILSMAYGDIDGDGDNDWVIANADSKVYLFVNDFPIVMVELFDNKLFYDMQLVDVTGDGKDDLIAIGGDVRGNANCKLYMYDISTLTPDSSRITVANVGYIYDFDVDDIDGDGYYDVAITTSTTTNGIGWYRGVQSLTAAALATDENTKVGTVLDSTDYTDTQASDDSWEKIQEDGGNLENIWTIGGVDGIKPTITIETKVSSGADEGFYFYYSTSSSSGPWIFMFAVPSSITTDTTYTFPLPLGTSGTIYIRAIDALNETSPSDVTDDILYVNLIKVVGINEVNYETYTKLTADTTYRAIGIGDFDAGATANLDFAVGKSGSIKVIDASGGTLNSTIATLDPGTEALSPNADTFEVADVNSDGLADIVSVATYSGHVVIIYEWLNVASGDEYHTIRVKNLRTYIGSVSGPDYEGDIMALCVENPYGT
ncbi:MAG TPA: type IV pilin [Euryarchaeota archaeon]|nr:type IV pilin [Euryarchaeota archaeon]